MIISAQSDLVITTNTGHPRPRSHPRPTPAAPTHALQRRPGHKRAPVHPQQRERGAGAPGLQLRAQRYPHRLAARGDGGADLVGQVVEASGWVWFDLVGVGFRDGLGTEGGASAANGTRGRKGFVGQREKSSPTPFATGSSTQTPKLLFLAMYHSPTLNNARQTPRSRRDSTSRITSVSNSSWSVQSKG